MTTLHFLTKKSVYTICKIFQEEVANAPTEREIAEFGIDAPLILHPEEIVAASSSKVSESRESKATSGRQQSTIAERLKSSLKIVTGIVENSPNPHLTEAVRSTYRFFNCCFIDPLQSLIIFILSGCQSIYNDFVGEYSSTSIIFSRTNSSKWEADYHSY